MPYAGMDPSGDAQRQWYLPRLSARTEPGDERCDESLRPVVLTDRAVSPAEVVPRLAAGVELLGEYQGSGLGEVTFLARNASGRVVHLSRLLWLVLSGVDGCRSVV